MDDVESHRVLLRVEVTAIPGTVARRPTTLWEHYCSAKLSRGSKLREGVDVALVPGGFELDKPVKRWFLYDAGITQTLEPEQVMKLPHRTFRVVTNEKGDLTFVEIKIDEKTISHMATAYDWKPVAR